MDDLSAVSVTDYDMIVIGGGCVGTSVAMFAANAGFKTALLERDDFGAGTTGASSELIHGGLQYLFKLRFDIVRKSNEYAHRIYRSARHLCEPLPIIIPCYRHGPVPYRITRLLMRIYDRYNRRLKQAPPSEKLTPAQVAEAVPNLLQDGLLGGIKYFEWWIDAPRMCVSNALWAAENGAFVRNHAGVVALETEPDGRIGVTIDDRRTKTLATLRAKVVINATGPWTDQICELAGIERSSRIRPTRGVHIIMPRITDVGLMLQFIDGRYGLVIPRRHCSVIGTTDDDYYGDLDEMVPTPDEVAYLFQGASQLLSGLSAADITDTRVGCRPTIHKYGQTEDKLPRDHAVETHDDCPVPGLISVYGGKLATHTLMAEDVLTIAAEQLGKPFDAPARYKLPGAPDESPDEYLEAVAHDAMSEYGVDRPTIEALIRRYGTRFKQVLGLTKDRPELAENLCQCRRDGKPIQRVLAAEVHYIVQHELAVTAKDVLRRTGLGVGQCVANRCLENVELILRKLGCPTIEFAAGPAGDAVSAPSSSMTGPG